MLLASPLKASIAIECTRSVTIAGPAIRAAVSANAPTTRGLDSFSLDVAFSDMGICFGKDYAILA
jgi:hypothetical protein